MWVQCEQGRVMALGPGWIEVGQRRSEMKKINVGDGDLGVWGPRPHKVWVVAHVERLILTISEYCCSARQKEAAPMSKSTYKIVINGVAVHDFKVG